MEAHNHCSNENVIDMEPYNDSSTNTIYIIHNNVIVCLKPKELRTILYPSPLQRPDDNDDAWTEEHKDPILYYWNILPVPNRINFEKSAVRIHGLEMYVNRKELIFLFESRYNTIALGIPKRDYEGNYPEEIDTFFESEDEEENVDFERTGLGRRRGVPQLPNLDPPLTENVYRCYPVSRLNLLRNWKIIDISFPSRTEIDTFPPIRDEDDEDPNAQEIKWGNTPVKSVQTTELVSQSQLNNIAIVENSSNINC